MEEATPMTVHWTGVIIGVLIGMAIMTGIWLVATWPRG
jgi:hypothetical protein